MSIDTSHTIEIANSLVKLVGLVAGGLAFVALSAFILISGAHGKYPEAVAQLVGWFGLVFFGACALIGGWRLSQGSGAPVTISRDGIRDTRVAAEFIPWRAIRGISTWQYQRQKIMVLAVDPAVERTLTLTRIARWSRGPNRALGADGLCVAATGLKIDYDTLFATSVAYARAHGGSA